MSLTRTGLLFGLAIWSSATAMFVPFGHVVFGPDNQIPIGISTFTIVVATFGAVYWFAASARP